jgi:quinol monooxygenase YgiN
MIIVQGSFFLDPADRDRFVTASTREIGNSRSDRGCLEFVLAADPVDDRRVVVSSRWESMDDLQSHHENARARIEAEGDLGAWPAVTGQDFAVFEVVSARTASLD